MEKILEDYLWNEIDNERGRFAYDVIQDMIKFGMINNPKQARATLDKWMRKGKWNFGSNICFGWKEQT